VALLVGGTLAVIFLDPPWSIVVIVLLAAVEVFEFRLWRWAVRQRAVGGTEGLVGQRGTLIAGDRVRIHGTTYPARAVGGQPGDEVVVEETQGMMLIVTAAPPLPE
jgi:membrane protein implicated in regulation of membrane protease activity